MNYYSRKGYPILPIGLVNLKTGKNAMFGVVWDGWERNRSACIILKRIPGLFSVDKPKYRVVVTSISGNERVPEVGKEHPVGSTMSFIHDQGGYDMGTWTVLGVVEHNEQGHQQIASLIGKSSVSFATFK